MHKTVVTANRNAGIINSQLAATRALLGCGVAAGLLSLLIFSTQILIRPEFRFARTEPSLLSLGHLGWIQIANSILGGLLVIAGALGMRRVLRGSKGGFWGPLFLVIFGIGQIGVGIFVVDPIRSPAAATLHGTMHLVFGGIGFVALMASCFVYLRTFISQKLKVWAILCAITGLMFLAAFLSAASHPDATSIQFFLNLTFVLEWVWVSSISARILRNVPKSRAGVSRQGNHRFENLFFSGMAVLILGTVFLGFARSYYLAGVFKAPLPNLIVHIHGAVFSSWILLLMAQTSLVAVGRVDLHRRLGLLGFALACLVLILGLLAATDSLGRHFAAGEPGVEVKALYAIPIADMLAFSTLIYFAFRERFNPAAHKRRILIATITLLDAAFVRWPVPAAWWDLRVAQMCCYPLLLLLIGYDLWSTGKVQRATLWASVFLIVLQQVRNPIERTVPWQSFATWMQNLARSFH
jgi:hypothetical protein